MISMVMLLLLMGIVVFGPKKTIEMAQSVVQALAQIKHAAGEYQSEVMAAVASDSENSERPKPVKIS
jgi:Sec-independent protein translocase protein TatA